MTSDEDKRTRPDRRSTDRRVADNPDFNGLDRRKGNRRSGKDRRTPG